VDYAWQREDAARVVRHLSGVEGIENRISVRDLAAVPGTSGPALDRP
jgi:hypothetical protein